MIATNYSNARQNFKHYCQKAVHDLETIIVTGKNNENVIIMGMDEYNRMVKSAANAEYIRKLDHSMEQALAGEVVTKTLEELREME